MALSMDFSTYGDGDIPAPLNLGGANWAVASGVAGNTPTLSEELAVNGGFGTDTVWDKGTNWTIGDGIATHAAGSNTSIRQYVTAANKWYKLVSDFNVTAGNLAHRMGSAYYTLRTGAGTFATVGPASAGTDAGVNCGTGGATSAGTIDNFSCKSYTLSDMFRLALFGSAYGTVKARWTILEQGHSNGVVMCMNDPANPATFVVAWADKQRAYLAKWVSGTFTLLVNATITYADDKDVEIRRAAGTDVFQLFYNNAQAGTDQTITGMTGLYHGLFGSGEGASCSRFFFLTS